MTTPNLPRAHASFAMVFIWAALAVALGGGFAIGAHLATVIGLDRPPGRGFATFIQVHGHLQLVGWAGLFIIGISLHFLPRLAGVSLARPHWRPRIALLVVGGLVLRALAHSVLPYAAQSPIFPALAGLVAFASMSELAGVSGYLILLLHTLQRARTTKTARPALESVRPFLKAMIAGWLLYCGINAVLALQMAQRAAVLMDSAWHEFAVNLFSGLVLLPMAFAFSVRMFPLYLRLPAADWNVRAFARLYVALFSLKMLPALPLLAAAFPGPGRVVSALGQVGVGLAILWWVWKLDVLLRWRAPWTVQRKFSPRSDRPPTRPGLPGYGEFGRFERLLYSAYGWLVLAALLDVLIAVAHLTGWTVRLGTDAVRHSMLLGFISLLILGMAARMLPGFLQKPLASPRLVGATFWLGNLAAVCRVFPLLLPVTLLENLPILVAVAQALFAMSGLWGMAAVACLAVNLRRTVRAPASLVQAITRK